MLQMEEIIVILCHANYILIVNSNQQWGHQNQPKTVFISIGIILLVIAIQWIII